MDKSERAKWITMGLATIFNLKASSITRTGERRIEKLRAIQRQGTINQDFGRSTFEYRIEGDIYGEDRRYNFDRWFIAEDLPLELVSKTYAYSKKMLLEYCYNERIPVVLSSIIDTTIGIISSLDFSQEASKPNVIHYSMTIIEISEIDSKTRLVRSMIGSLTGQISATASTGLRDVLNLITVRR